MDKNISDIQAQAQNLQTLRHSAAHVMAAAVKRLYPNTKLAIGPAIANGFYYDFDSETVFTPEILEAIEKEMKSIIKENAPFETYTLPRAEAEKYLTEQNETYKVELLTDIPEGEDISFYKLGSFTDLCRGPHIEKAGGVKAFKLMSCNSAYWRGDERNKMLQRIYGTAFFDKESLKAHLEAIEEAKKRDHRRLGAELDLFSIDDYVGGGLVLWHPKLSVVREEIESYWRKEHRKHGYQYIYTPNLGLSHLWETSGHLDHFSDIMYPPMSFSAKDKHEDVTYYAKPMSCPFHIRIYKSHMHSYRELPIRYCELGTVYRYEMQGALHGMMRVRGFTQDDAHIICRQDQFVDEVNDIIDFAIEMNKVFGFDNLNVYLSVRDSNNKDKYIENEEIWQLAESTLEQVLNDKAIPFKKDIGGAKFYGPAIDLKAVDAMGREWQGTTIQLDMNLPERFGMVYTGSDGAEHTPIMLHRTLLGSMERFVGTLIEHYGGAFPTWLAPVQVKILPISEKQSYYATSILLRLKSLGLRVELDDRNEKIGKKIREAQLQKIPYMIVVGEKEAENGTITLRSRKQGDLGALTLDEFLQWLTVEIEDKTIN